MVFTGASAQPIPFAGTSLLWKGVDRYEVEALDTHNGRFRLEMDDHNGYMLAPEGTHPTATIDYSLQPSVNDRVTIDTRIYRFVTAITADGDVLIGATPDASWTNLTYAINDDGGVGGEYQVGSAHPHTTASIDTALDIVTLVSNSSSRIYLYCSVKSAKASSFETPCTALWKFYGDEWCRFTYGANTVMSLHREYDGSLIAGTYEGNVLRLEDGDLDSDQDIYVELLSPYSEGDSPVARKDAEDFQIHGKTGGSVGTINFYVDQQEFPGGPSKTLTYSMLREGVYRAQISDLPPFLRLQVEIFGGMGALSLHAIGLTVSTRPPHVMSLSFGEIVPPNNGDLAWINQVELDVEAAHDLYLDVYKNGVLHCTETVPVRPGYRDVYTVTVPRDTKGRRLALRLRTSYADSEGFNGFECYGAKVRHAATGNFSELEIGQGGDGRSDQ
jgi:hypothetical protein